MHLTYHSLAWSGAHPRPGRFVENRPAGYKWTPRFNGGRLKSDAPTDLSHTLFGRAHRFVEGLPALPQGRMTCTVVTTTWSVTGLPAASGDVLQARLFVPCDAHLAHDDTVVSSDLSAGIQYR